MNENLLIFKSHECHEISKIHSFYLGFLFECAQAYIAMECMILHLWSHTPDLLIETSLPIFPWFLEFFPLSSALRSVLSSQLGRKLLLLSWRAFDVSYSRRLRASFVFSFSVSTFSSSINLAVRLVMVRCFWETVNQTRLMMMNFNLNLTSQNFAQDGSLA